MIEIVKKPRNRFKIPCLQVSKSPLFRTNMWPFKKYFFHCYHKLRDSELLVHVQYMYIYCIFALFYLLFAMFHCLWKFVYARYPGNFNLVFYVCCYIAICFISLYVIFHCYLQCHLLYNAKCYVTKLSAMLLYTAICSVMLYTIMITITRRKL